MNIQYFKSLVWEHYRIAGRNGLPWRKTRDPYCILISEIMLQQTQVARVEGYYAKFLKQFPEFRSLAAAKESAILKMWQGLGYNRRALFLKKLAKVIVADFGGKLPRNRATLESLPGIGRGTSGSLMAFAFNEPEIFIETNIRRVFIHFFFRDREGVTDAALERYIKESLRAEKNPRKWYWALMDYGAAIKGMAEIVNPNRQSRIYKKQSAFKGSHREMRGKILRSVLSNGKIPVSEDQKFKKAVEGLLREGFIRQKKNFIFINDQGS